MLFLFPHQLFPLVFFLLIFFFYRPFRSNKLIDKRKEKKVRKKEMDIVKFKREQEQHKLHLQRIRNTTAVLE
jgi:hypothetical protein